MSSRPSQSAPQIKRARLRALLALCAWAAAPLSADPLCETVRFKDKFTLQFPSGYHVKADSDRVQPTVSFAKLDNLYRIDARVCRPDQQERKLSMEKVFWASGIGTDELEKKEQLPNGDFLLVSKTGLPSRYGGSTKAAYFAKGSRGYLQVNVAGPDSLKDLVRRIAGSLRNIESRPGGQQAMPLRLVEYVYDHDSVRVLVPETAKPDPVEPAAYYFSVDELDNVRLFSRSGFDYPYDELGNWQGPKGEDRDVVSSKIINHWVHVLQMKPKGNKMEFYCYLGKEKENKIVIAGPQEYGDVMKLMAESVGVR